MVRDVFYGYTVLATLYTYWTKIPFNISDTDLFSEFENLHLPLSKTSVQINIVFLDLWSKLQIKTCAC